MVIIMAIDHLDQFSVYGRARYQLMREDVISPFVCWDLAQSQKQKEPDDARNQGIRNHSIELVCTEYALSYVIRVNA